MVLHSPNHLTSTSTHPYIFSLVLPTLVTINVFFFMINGGSCKSHSQAQRLIIVVIYNFPYNHFTKKPHSLKNSSMHLEPRVMYPSYKTVCNTNCAMLCSNCTIDSSRQYVSTTS